MKVQGDDDDARSADAVPGCPFCGEAGGAQVWRDARCRVVLAPEPFTGFCRVVWNRHVKEMTDLAPDDRAHLMRVVFATEAALRILLSPQKMNIASLGNLVPHVHWHVIPRFADDSHFPQPVWGERQRNPRPAAPPAGFETAISARLAAELGASA